MAGGNSYLDNLRLGQNPILTNLAMGYSNGDFVADKIYPVIPIDAFPTLRIPEMNRAHLKVIEDLRTLYGDVARRQSEGLTYQDVSLREYSQEVMIDIQEQMNASVIDLKRTRTYALTESLLLNVEKSVANEVQTVGNYTNSNSETLAGVDQWTHSSSDPIGQIWDAKEVIRALIGRFPNTMILGATSAWSLQKNTNVVLAIKGTNQGGTVTLKQLAEYLDLKGGIHVGTGVYDSSKAITDTYAPVDIWLDNCLLAYVTQKAKDKRSMYIPTFGYTFVHSVFRPSIKTYQSEDQKKTIIQGTMIWARMMYNNACAYLFKDTNI